MPRDGAKVLEWFGQAAEQGLAAAQAYVGLMYAKGRGVPQDWARAHLWLSLAARQGDKDAADARGLIAKKNDLRTDHGGPTARQRMEC